LNDFLCSDEVATYEKQKVGRTTLVYHQGRLVAYYTISNDQLRTEYVKKHTGFSLPNEMRLEGIPAITIGRLAVSKEWQKRGLGTAIIQKIAMYALHCSTQSGIRLLLVRAKKNAFGFYEKMGFQYVIETRREKQRIQNYGTKTMFFDLKTLSDLES